MPIYEYGCQSCGHAVEVMHAVEGVRPTTCEVCGGTLRKLMSAPAIVFKGSGWAKKDAQTARHTSSTKAATEGDKAAPAASGDQASTAATGGEQPAKSDQPAKSGQPAKSDQPAKSGAGSGKKSGASTPAADG